jgi:hypothetical protein
MADQVKAAEWKNLRCLYAEDLKGKRVAVCIAGVRETPKEARLFCQSGTSEAWDVCFDKKDAAGRTTYIQIPKPNDYGKATGLLRTYKAAAGGEPDQSHVGTEITLIPVNSKKSATGEAIRIAIPERHA